MNPRQGRSRRRVSCKRRARSRGTGFDSAKSASIGRDRASARNELHIRRRVRTPDQNSARFHEPPAPTLVRRVHPRWAANDTRRPATSSPPPSAEWRPRRAPWCCPPTVRFQEEHRPQPRSSSPANGSDDWHRMQPAVSLGPARGTSRRASGGVQAIATPYACQIASVSRRMLRS